MARDAGPPLLSYLQNARTYAEQSSALRSLKNDIVGHAQKKETWVALGALELVINILQGCQAPSRSTGKPRRPSKEARSLGEDEGVRLQVLQVLASFANGGTPFVAPLIAAHAVPGILSNLSPDRNSPLVVAAALRALINIAENELSFAELQIVANELFAPQHIHALGEICVRSDEWRLPLKQTPTTLVAILINRLCRDEEHAVALADSEVLDQLAKVLASFAVVGGYVIPGAEVHRDGRVGFIPGPPPAGSSLSAVLDALSTIIVDSRYRASRLLYSPYILAVFPHIPFAPSSEAMASWSPTETIGREILREQDLSAVDYLLPPVSSAQKRGAGSNSMAFPPLGTSGHKGSPLPFSRSTSGKFGHGLPVMDNSSSDTRVQGEEDELDDYESPLIPWLIVLARTRGGLERLTAASLLTCLFKNGSGGKSFRESAIGLFVVPLLVHMLQHYDALHKTFDPTTADSEISLRQDVLERAPSVLSRLVIDSELLQKAAYDCGVVKVLSKLLKDAYEPVPASVRVKQWSPHPETGMDAVSSSPVCQLGPDTQPPLLLHYIRMRESVLKAISALAAGKDEYRKAFVEQDAISFLVQSLSLAPTKPLPPKERSKPEQPDGPVQDVVTSEYGTNSLSVIIAACHAIRMLSRSVSILRTTLVDHAVALPVYRLLTHPDVSVQIAASAAICNLVTEASPMRELLAERGVMKVLCDLAHSHTAALRLNALWALKHFVNAANTASKKQCLEQLEPGWLVRLVCDDTEDDALYNSRLDKPSSVDRSPDLDEDVDMDQADNTYRLWSGEAAVARGSEGKSAAWATQAEAKMATLRDAEVSPQRKARNNDLAIQEQGLDFIRNLIGTGGYGAGPDSPSESTEMIDHLFREIGQDRFFDILMRKLQAKMLCGGSRRMGTGSGEARILYPQSKIIEAVVYILVHIAASVPQHRQLIIAQPGLLKLLSNHFASKDKEVRVALCHLVNNLTWQDDDGDARACAIRAHELRKLGILTKLEGLEEDGELDVRERAKTALWQMKNVTSM